MVNPPSRARNVAAMLLLLVAAGAGAARAEPPGRLSDRGSAVREAGRDADALVLLERAYGREPSPRAAAQVGLVRQALGNWVEAERQLRRR